MNKLKSTDTFYEIQKAIKKQRKYFAKRSTLSEKKIEKISLTGSELKKAIVLFLSIKQQKANGK